MDAELGLLVARYRAREEEADPQERRRPGFLRQKTGACSFLLVLSVVFGCGLRPY